MNTNFSSFNLIYCNNSIILQLNVNVETQVIKQGGK